MWAISSHQFIASVRLNGGSSKNCWIIITHNINYTHSHACCKKISDTLIHPYYIVECENFVAKKKYSKQNLSQIIHYVTTHYMLCRRFCQKISLWVHVHTYEAEVSIISFAMMKPSCVSGRRFINHINKVVTLFWLCKICDQNMDKCPLKLWSAIFWAHERHQEQLIADARTSRTHQIPYHSHNVRVCEEEYLRK